MRCRNCGFFRPDLPCARPMFLMGRVEQDTFESLIQSGRCDNEPGKVVVIDPKSLPITVWPHVTDEDGCDFGKSPREIESGDAEDEDDFVDDEDEDDEDVDEIANTETTK